MADEPSPPHPNRLTRSLSPEDPGPHPHHSTLALTLTPDPNQESTWLTQFESVDALRVERNPSLQPYATAPCIQAATLWHPGCNPTPSRLQPYAIQAATLRHP